jgi:hypothetical protein
VDNYEQHLEQEKREQDQKTLEALTYKNPFAIYYYNKLQNLNAQHDSLVNEMAVQITNLQDLTNLLQSGIDDFSETKEILRVQGAPKQKKVKKQRRI